MKKIVPSRASPVVTSLGYQELSRSRSCVEGSTRSSALHQEACHIHAMPNTCAVSGCFGNETGVRLHRFPKDEQQRQKWADLCNRRTPISANSRICSLHFMDSDYEKNLMYELLGIPVPKNTVRLKDGALPTLRLPAPAGKGNDFIS